MMVNLPCLMVSSTNFLRPTCSYTECLLSFQTGSVSYGENFCKLQLLFISFDFTGLPLPQSTDFPWTLTLILPVGLCADAVPFTLHRYRVPFQNPARPQNLLKPGKALEFVFLLVYAAVISCFSGRLMSFNIFFGS